MNLSTLQLTSTEEQILRTIITHENLTATDIIQKTGVHRKVVYDSLSRLSTRALITSQKQGKERFFAFQGAHAILSEIENITQSTQERIQELKQLHSELLKIVPQNPHDSWSVYGTTGVRSVLTLLLQQKKDYDILGVPRESETQMGDIFWHNFHAKQKELGIKVRGIFNANTKDWTELSNNKNMTLRKFSLLNPLSEIIICSPYVITIIWTENPTSHVIRNTAYAKTQQDYFNHLWKQTRLL